MNEQARQDNKLYVSLCCNSAEDAKNVRNIIAANLDKRHHLRYDPNSHDDDNNITITPDNYVGFAFGPDEIVTAEINSWGRLCVYDYTNYEQEVVNLREYLHALNIKPYLDEDTIEFINSGNKESFIVYDRDWDSAESLMDVPYTVTVYTYQPPCEPTLDTSPTR